MVEPRKSIFVTGAASGMGRATAVLFARSGWFVGAYDVNQDGLASLKTEIGEANGIFAPLDKSKLNNLGNMEPDAFASAMSSFGTPTGGTLDLMFNNAGIAAGGLLDEQPWSEIQRIIDINLMGVIIGARLAIPLLRNTPGSLLLNMSSSSAIFGTAGISIYSATKHAVRGLTEALSIELKRFGVRAADLLPGLIDTPLLGDQMRAMAPTEGMWRLIDPAEVAGTVWDAYHQDKLHWYVPEELRDFHRQVVDEPELVREERTALLAAMTVEEQ